jgi:pyridinium-3,5-biscarboxylic acid mononucleotide sulfurtransferase
MIGHYKDHTSALLAKQNYERLEDWFRQFDSALIAFSAGVDSSILALAAKEALSQKAIAATSISNSFSKSEIVYSRRMAQEIGIELVTVFQDDLSNEGYVSNQVNRCYFCRSNLASAIMAIVKDRGISVWVDGTHLDDMKSPRPGVKALRESGFKAPLVELGLRKEEIREMARYKALSNADRPSEACLSSRVAYGQKIDEVTLRRIEEAERFVLSLIDVKILRVRTIERKAILEMDYGSIPGAKKSFKEIEAKLKSLGYESVEIDPQGYRSGRMLELFISDGSS